MIAKALCLASLALQAAAAPSADEVLSLPGWSGPLPSKIYSGHIDAGSDVQDGITRSMKMWYMYVEAEVADPSTAPTMLFSNGGPGASSAFGLFTELGPFTLSDASMKTNPPTLFRNPYTWTKLANILILNGPAPVGYSYCLPAGPSGDGRSCGSWNDTRTNDFNFRFLTNFYKAFPERLSSELIIAGESYAGVYTSMLVQSILDARSPIKLRGLMLGDACLGTDVMCGGGNPEKGPWLSILFTAGQGCVSLATFEAILAQCPMQILRYGPMDNAPQACQAAVAAADTECPGNAYYGYNYLDSCPVFNFAAGGGAAADPPVPAEPSGYPCGGDQALAAWITLPEVKAALHVAPNSNYWSFDNGEGFVYNVSWPTGLPLMRRLQTGADGIKVLVYNGETDPSVSSVRSQRWTFELGFPLKEAWRPWTFGGNSSDIVAGSVVQWEGDFTHATVRGSGHMVSPRAPFALASTRQVFPIYFTAPLTPHPAAGARIQALQRLSYAEELHAGGMAHSASKRTRGAAEPAHAGAAARRIEGGRVVSWAHVWVCKNIYLPFFALLKTPKTHGTPPHQAYPSGSSAPWARSSSDMGRHEGCARTPWPASTSSSAVKPWVSRAFTAAPRSRSSREA